MKRIALIICAALITITAIAQPKTKLRPNETVLLYGTELIDNTDPVVGKVIKSAGYTMEEASGLTGPETITDKGNIGNISVNARVDLYFPKKPNGQMVVVCPGGGYSIVSSYNEGVYVADWMLSKGVTVAVVKYRLPNGHWGIPLTDIQNAFRYCRAHAEEWGINQIGVMGFSAGGHLAATTSNLFVDDVTRPDFSILIYPVITMEKGITHKGTHDLLIGKESKWDDKSKSVTQWTEDMKQYEALMNRYSMENRVTTKTPPTFIIHCQDDTVVPIENTIRYYKNLVVNKVPAEIHFMPYGDHGWGFSKAKFVGEGNDWVEYLRHDYEACLERWMKSIR